ncbi:response regulator transcription factor [Falsiroseomonas sp. E2-1-a20]|uniref:response regulator transcription factor n=1 Tax=Falsiroseomonas sp. E2-1-a20 TaxID=3239300 RepID=UPI003F372776
MPAPRPVLVIEDDIALRETLAEEMRLEGAFLVDEAASAAEAEALLRLPHARYDAIVLDIGLPDGDGRDLCARLRKQGHHMPILMLTGVQGEQDIVRGLDAGANDYIAKPFRVSELMARLRAQLRVFDTSEDATFMIGRYTFRPSSRMLLDTAGRKIRLTQKEAEVLRYLYGAGGQPVERQILLNEVWGYNNAVSTHTLETHIYRLRQKIELDPSNPSLLLTKSGSYGLTLHN